jgi:repressor of nif and glnA expression
VELIQYAGSSLDPSEVFIRARMTSVSEAAKRGEGKILANFREIPALCRGIAEKVVAGLKEAKDLVDGAPKPVKEGVSKEEAGVIEARVEPTMLQV